LDEVYRLAKEYYAEFDPVQENVKTVINSKTKSKRVMADDIQPVDGEFDF
jgi:hypothetical protein